MPRSLVVVELMPDQFRDSHKAAGNWGKYPHNGSLRYCVDLDTAKELCEGDEYNHEVPNEHPPDYPEYA